MTKKTAKKPTKKTTQKAKKAADTPNLPPEDLLVRCQFIPREDITAYEMSVLLHYILKGRVTLADWNALEEKHEGITRHLQPVPDEEDAAPVSD